MALILVVLAVLTWTSLLAMFLFRWLYAGVDFWFLLERSEIISGMAMTLGSIVYVTFCTAVIVAILMGIAGAISYRKPSAHVADSDQPQGSALPDQLHFTP